jgi:hypothetical protein
MLARFHPFPFPRSPVLHSPFNPISSFMKMKTPISFNPKIHTVFHSQSQILASHGSGAWSVGLGPQHRVHGCGAALPHISTTTSSLGSSWSARHVSWPNRSMASSITVVVNACAGENQDLMYLSLLCTPCLGKRPLLV